MSEWGLQSCNPTMFNAARQGAGKVEHLGHGLYEARCWKGGTEQRVLVDELLPSIDKRPAFGGSKQDVEDLILQKAYAKLHGSYEWILSADWSKASLPHDAECWKAPKGLDSEHPLAAVAMQHALSMAEGLYGSPLAGKEGQSQQHFLEEFASEFSSGTKAQRDLEIASLENRVGAIPVGEMVVSGGPSQQPVMADGRTLHLSPSEAAWVRIVVSQPAGHRSVFLNIYEDDGDVWMQNASGFAHQQKEEFVFEVYLEPRDKPYLIVAAATLDSFGTDFTIDIESPVALDVREG